jgi:predicted HTH domain antitoxin
MKVKSIRIPKDIDRAIAYVSRAEKIENTHSLRKLARMGFESYVTKEYKAGKITLREASDLLNLTLSETIDLLSDMGVKGNIHAEDVMRSLESLTQTNP